MALGTCPQRHQECSQADLERWNTPPNWITLTRTLAAVVLALASAPTGSLTLLLVATGVYWIGDMADGAVARMLRKETRTGAVLDIVCDRICAAAIYVGLVWLMPEMWIPIAVYLISFSVLDLMLSLSFLLFPLSSPNYFALIDPMIYRLNWSRVAKGLNSALFLAVVILSESATAAGVIAVALMIVKIISLRLLSQVQVEPVGECAHELRQQHQGVGPP
ncbi:MAG: CDP-alcohol phosphatidyltransferase family protein [Ornithinimicrobium sp.]